MQSKEFTISENGTLTVDDDNAIRVAGDKTLNVSGVIARELDGFEKKKVKFTITVKVEEI